MTSQRVSFRVRPARRAITAALLAALSLPLGAAAGELELPYAEAGLSEREAAAHLLDRLAYGARPGEVERVLAMGLSEWVERQLAGDLPDPELARRLAPFDALAMSAQQIAETFPPPGLALRRTQDAGLLAGADDSEATAAGAADETMDERERRRRLLEALDAQGYRRQRELIEQLQAQKVVRAIYAENQLRERLVDFWFDHFNVSTADNRARGHVLAYERDAIRPHVLGSFRELLEATARHPAMLHYLDNVSSRAEDGRRLALDVERERETRRGALGRRGFGAGRLRSAARGSAEPRVAAARNDGAAANQPIGLNENYARELLELHTLGVDGGYTQQDVVEVARAFTGWSAVPPPSLRPKRVGRELRFLERAGARAGFVSGEDGFLFHPGWHDAEKKTVLGVALPAGRGIADGEQVLDLVATHPSTARHLATKIATRFVSDDPAPALVSRLAAVFAETGGDIEAVMRALVSSKEFWSSRGEKVKSPFELAVSAARALAADVDQPFSLAQAIARMGQPLYAYEAPTGYPDRADFWVNTGALVQRMSFGLALAAGRVDGVRFELDVLLGGREPADLDDALHRFAAVLLPERDLEVALAELERVAAEPELALRVEEKASAASASPNLEAPRPPATPLPPLAQVVGVLLGSPAFQQR